MKLLYVLLILTLLLTTPVFAHHRDGHSGGPPDDKGKPDDKPSKKPKESTNGGHTCVEILITNDRTQYGRCVLYDFTSPSVTMVVKTPNFICAQISDDIGVKEVVADDGWLVQFWQGSYNWFCSSQQFSILDIEDFAGNRFKYIRTDSS